MLDFSVQLQSALSAVSAVGGALPAGSAADIESLGGGDDLPLDGNGLPLQAMPPGDAQETGTGFSFMLHSDPMAAAAVVEPGLPAPDNVLANAAADSTGAGSAARSSPASVAGVIDDRLPGGIRLESDAQAVSIGNPAPGHTALPAAAAAGISSPFGLHGLPVADSAVPASPTGGLVIDGLTAGIEGETAGTRPSIEGADASLHSPTHGGPAHPGINQPSAAQSPAQSVLPAGAALVPGGPDWSNALAQRVGWMLEGQLGRAEIAIDPPELGPLQVRITTLHDQTQVQFLSQHAAVRDALDQALPRLREMLEAQGLQLAHADVSDQQQGNARRDTAVPLAGLAGEPDDGNTGLSSPSDLPPRHLGLVDAYA